MKLYIALCLFGMAIAAPAPTPETIKRYHYDTDNVQLLRFENENPGAGSYKFAFEQSDGTKQEQQGDVINEGREDETIVMSGTYSWIGPDGVTYKVDYTADNEGFKPVLQQGPGGSIPEDVIAAFLG